MDRYKENITLFVTNEKKDTVSSVHKLNGKNGK